MGIEQALTGRLRNGNLDGQWIIRYQGNPFLKLPYFSFPDIE